jgi:hypothetical protein
MQDMQTFFDALADRLKGETSVGFVARQTRHKVFVGDKGDCLWYFWDPNASGGRGSHIPIDVNTLVGRITNVSTYVKTSTDYGDAPKLLVDVSADHEYVLESGLDNAFSRSLLAAMAAAGPDRLQGQVTIEVLPGEKPKVVMANLYAGDLVMSGPYRDRETLDMLAHARENLGLPAEQSADNSGTGGDSYSTEETQAPQAAAPPSRPTRGLPGA